MLTPSESQALAAHVSNDPNGKGYAAMNGNPTDIAAAGNAADSSLSVGYLTRDQQDFVGSIYPAIAKLGMASSAVRQKYQPLLDSALSLPRVYLTNDIKAALNAMITDGLLTSAQVTAAMTKTPASDFETVLGADRAVSVAEVGEALFGANA